MTVRAPSPLIAAVGLAAVTADELRRLPTRLPALLGTAASVARERYEELAEHGQDVLSGLRGPAEPDPWAEIAVDGTDLPGTGLTDAELDAELLDGALLDLEAEPVHEPATGTPEPAPAIGLTGPVTLSEEQLDEVAQLPSGAELAHADLPLEDFDHLTVPQLRGRLRTLSLPQLVQLRDYETAHGNRLPVLTLLDNRMAKLTATGSSLPD